MGTKIGEDAVGLTKIGFMKIAKKPAIIVKIPHAKMKRVSNIIVTTTKIGEDAVGLTKIGFMKIAKKHAVIATEAPHANIIQAFSGIVTTTRVMEDAME